MSIQNPFGTPSNDGKLSLTWETVGTPIAISVQIALDAECTADSRTFVLPKDIRSCTLDTGSGKWFYRVGAWLGTPTDGIIEWTGIYGPATIQSARAQIPLAEFPIQIYAVKPALNSVVFHTGLYESYYMVIHASTTDSFKASKLKTYYKQDWGTATVQVSNLDAGATYHFQLQTLVGDKSRLPSNTIQLLTDVYNVHKKRTGMPVQGRSGTDRATYAADSAMLKEAAERPSQRFFSYAHYLQFQAAKERTSASQQ